jgi:hypothetical protein
MADDVRHQDRRELSGLGHGTPPAAQLAAPLKFKGRWSSATPKSRPTSASNSVSASISATSWRKSDGDLIGDGVNIAARLAGRR